MIATSAKRKRLTHSVEQKLSSWIILSLDLVYLDKNRGQEIKSIEKRFFPMKLRNKKYIKQKYFTYTEKTEI